MDGVWELKARVRECEGRIFVALSQQDIEVGSLVFHSVDGPGAGRTVLQGTSLFVDSLLVSLVRLIWSLARVVFLGLDLGISVVFGCGSIILVSLLGGLTLKLLRSLDLVGGG